VAQIHVLDGLILVLAIIIFSIKAFVIPIAEREYTDLSVESIITLATPHSMAEVSTLSDPKIFVLVASTGKNSQLGTCLRAAAWKI
jgi:hypothetical protein